MDAFCLCVGVNKSGAGQEFQEEDQLFVPEFSGAANLLMLVMYFRAWENSGGWVPANSWQH